MADLLVYNDIGDFFDGVTAAAVADELNTIPTNDRNLNVRINSVGGSVADGIAIRNLLRSFASKRRIFDPSFKLTTIVDGFAYSAASVIALAGDEIVMNSGSMLMIHKAWMWAMGNSDELVSLSDYLLKIDGELAGLYASRTGKESKDMLTLMKAETYFTSAEAVAAKLADRVDEQITANGQLKGVANDIRASGYKNVYKGRIEAARVAAKAKGQNSKPTAAPDLSWLLGYELQARIDQLELVAV